MKIEICGIKRAITLYNDLLADAISDEDTEEIEENKRNIVLVETLKDGVEVVTFEDYYNLLKKISNLTDGQYTVWNCGLTIELFEDYY